MEFTITTVVYIFAGIIALVTGILVYMYFSGGIGHNIELLLGVLGW